MSAPNMRRARLAVRSSVGTVGRSGAGSAGGGERERRGFGGGGAARVAARSGEPGVAPGMRASPSTTTADSRRLRPVLETVSSAWASPSGAVTILLPSLEATGGRSPRLSWSRPACRSPTRPPSPVADPPPRRAKLNPRAAPLPDSGAPSDGAPPENSREKTPPPRGRSAPGALPPTPKPRPETIGPPSLPRPRPAPARNPSRRCLACRGSGSAEQQRHGLLLLLTNLLKAYSACKQHEIYRSSPLPQEIGMVAP